MSSSRHSTKKTQSVLVLGHGFLQKINDTTIYAEKMYSPNLTISGKTYCLSLNYNGDNSYLFVNGKQVVNFKSQNFKLDNQYPGCLGNISSDFNQADRKSTGLNVYIYDFSVDYSAITNDKILDIHKYLMEKSNLV